MTIISFLVWIFTTTVFKARSNTDCFACAGQREQPWSWDFSGRVLACTSKSFPSMKVRMGVVQPLVLVGCAGFDRLETLLVLGSQTLVDKFKKTAFGIGLEIDAVAGRNKEVISEVMVLDVMVN
jgi:hypothetical protein